MKKIKLTRGQIAIIDNEDFEKVSKFKWNYATVGYATNKKFYLHHLIIGKPKKGFVVDHINQNKLDNRKCNLRFVTHSQNHANQIKQKNNTSGFRGVSWNKGKWEVRIKYFGKTLHFGMFNNKIDAAKRYNIKAHELFGEFALLNKV